MRILFINPVGQIGGAERVLLDCIASIRAAVAEHEIHLLLMDDGPLAVEARRLGASVIIIPAPQAIRELGDSAAKRKNRSIAKLRLIFSMIAVAPRMRKYVKQLRRAIESISPDVIHSNGLKSHLFLSQSKLDTPIVWHIHDFVGSRPMMAGLLRRFSCNANPIAISNAVAEDIRGWLPGSSPVVVLNGIDVERFSPGPGNPERLDELSELPPGEAETVRVGLVATYARWKGQDLFLRAANRLLHNPPEVPIRCYLIGGPIYTTRGSQFSRDELETMVRELGLSGRVGLVPFQTDPAAIYRTLDIVVHASSQPEPFGLTIAEAMACGRPVIVSGAGELVRHGVDGIRITVGDIDGMANWVKELARNREIRNSLGAAARATAQARFDRRRMGAELLGVYERLTTER